MIEVKDTGAATAMPRYQCHKKVWALKIAALEFDEDGSARIAPANDGPHDMYAPFAVKDFRRKYHGGIPGDRDFDLGYFVQYDDGYVSWSPTQAFEEGYTRLSP